MPYLVHEGRIQTWSLECHPVDHCNLRCDGCCQLSPHLPEAYLPVETLRADLARLKPVLRPAVFKLTGGEPLLHPRVVELAEVAREATIADAVQITTNGTRLIDAPEALFDAVDRVKVSWYASAPLPEKTIDRIRARCEAARVTLELREYASFQRLDPPEMVRDEAWARRAFDGCWIRWRCHTVHRGRFYTCSRPPHLEPYLAAHGHHRALAQLDGVPLDGAPLDGVPLDEHSSGPLAESIRHYLERVEPLASCQSCLGNEGAWRPHAQLRVRRP